MASSEGDETNALFWRMHIDPPISEIEDAKYVKKHVSGPNPDRGDGACASGHASRSGSFRSSLIDSFSGLVPASLKLASNLAKIWERFGKKSISKVSGGLVLVKRVVQFENRCVQC
ncbi:MAG TPA: hypothetical protein VJN71_06965 [Nitrososphaerales archaeon]|nr:hypothetical protein [Nitrososphaerales archaeon]